MISDKSNSARRDNAPHKDASANTALNEPEWLEGDIPRSPRFSDTYYSKADGLSETLHVFLAGNRLAEGFAGIAPDAEFIIGELGFGTGLNFLATLRLWRETAPVTARLTFVSFEQFPLDAAAMTKALSRWPKLVADAAALARAWNTDYEFFEYAPEENTRLVVFLGDANTRLPKLDLQADAWFLDGFAPAKNPELWNADLMATVAAKTKPGGSFATYTAAGQVRRDLEAAGFTVTRRQGFARKREMLAGWRQG